MLVSAKLLSELVVVIIICSTLDSIRIGLMMCWFVIGIFALISFAATLFIVVLNINYKFRKHE